MIKRVSIALKLIGTPDYSHTCVGVLKGYDIEGHVNRSPLDYHKNKYYAGHLFSLPNTSDILEATFIHETKVYVIMEASIYESVSGTINARIRYMEQENE